MITDLRLDEETLFNQINKDTRYQIRRAEKEGVAFQVSTSADIKRDPAALEEFKKEYSEFTSTKGIRNTYNDNAVAQYVENNHFLLTKAVCGEDTFAQHTFLVDGTTARGLYSVSNFRVSQFNPRVIGKANKFLHWADMCYLKKCGFSSQDWGGISNPTDPNGVDSFKLGFGGQIHTYYHMLKGTSPLGKAAILLIKLHKKHISGDNNMV